MLQWCLGYIDNYSNDARVVCKQLGLPYNGTVWMHSNLIVHSVGE